MNPDKLIILCVCAIGEIMGKVIEADSWIDMKKDPNGPLPPFMYYDLQQEQGEPELMPPQGHHSSGKDIHAEGYKNKQQHQHQPPEPHSPAQSQHENWSGNHEVVSYGIEGNSADPVNALVDEADSGELTLDDILSSSKGQEIILREAQRRINLRMNKVIDQVSEEIVESLEGDAGAAIVAEKEDRNQGQSSTQNSIVSYFCPMLLLYIGSYQFASLS